MTSPRDDIADHAIRIYGSLCMAVGVTIGLLLARLVWL